MKKSRKDFIRAAHLVACSDWKKKIEKEFPKLFLKKEELIVGKWYVRLDFPKTVLLCKQVVDYGFTGCGIDDEGEWDYYYTAYNDRSDVRPATNKEVEAALIKEAKKRGLWGDVEIVEHVDVFYRALTNFSDGWMPSSERLYNKKGVIFYKGKWATPVKEEPITELTLEDVAKLKGVSVDKIRIKE